MVIGLILYYCIFSMQVVAYGDFKGKRHIY